MQTSREELEAGIAAIVSEDGEWTTDIPLPHGVWTRGNLGIPNHRTKRFVQAAADVSRKPLSECRVLDLACLDGLYSIEFAQQGCEVVGVEIRAAHLRKANFAKDALGLSNVTFFQDDVRNISEDKYGRFDFIVCSGILYHLTAPEVFDVVERMFSMVDRAVVIDTHISLAPNMTAAHKDCVYHGHLYREHDDSATDEQKEANGWASIDNTTSFWPTQSSLLNLLWRTGFTSAYECLNPPTIIFEPTGMLNRDRKTFIAIKDEAARVVTCPLVNETHDPWREESELPTTPIVAPSLAQRIVSRLGRESKKLFGAKS